MELNQEILSGFLDEELDPEATHKVESILAKDQDLQVELEILKAANVKAQNLFNDMLTDLSINLSE